MTRNQRYLLVFVLSFPFALGLREVLQRVLREDLATAATAYVRQRKEAPLSDPLRKILADTRHSRVKSQPHALLGRRAPAFDLCDDRGLPVRFAPGGGRPTVVVFYFGYNCVHCVAQLFALDEDVALFDELGARVIAVSADPPEQTAAQFKKFGRFGFDVAADPGNRVAEAYGVYRPAAGDQPEAQQHGTFLVDGDGRLFWANYGAEPFLDNKTLLIEIARNGGLAPAS